MKSKKDIHLEVSGDANLIEFLFASYPERKRGDIRRLVKYHSVLVNAKVVARALHPLHAGDTITIQPPKSAISPRKLPPHPEIIHEDDDIIVIDKPARLLTIATDRERERTAYHQMNDYLRAAYPNRDERIFIVHRLDRDTSGLLILARTEQAKQGLQDRWKQVEKRYYAIVEGIPSELEGTITSHLREDRVLKMRSVSPSQESKLAVTKYRVLRSRADRALLDVSLETGRKNQIRVQLSELGHPIVGDKKYGAKTDFAKRLCLHAYLLEFRHPITGEPLHIESELPESLQRLV